MKAQESLNAAVTAATDTQISQHGWTPELIKFLALSLLAFTLSALIISAVLLWRSRATSNQVLRTMGVISIIGFSALLLIVGYSNEQLTPIIGLFGAVAGYLLGKDASTSKAAILPSGSTGIVGRSTTPSE
ncbi:hypothetical protein D3C85_1479100 [compost metagenome]